MTTLIEQLTSEFATFKVEYLTKVQIWSEKQKQKIDELHNWYYSIKKEIVHPKTYSEREEILLGGRVLKTTIYKKDYSHMSQEQKDLFQLFTERYEQLNKTYGIYRMTTEQFITKQIDTQSKWFDASVVKLAVKVEAKGLNLQNLQITSTYVDQNLCTIITDGDKKVKAQTIFANGEIKAPHFRYLIK